MKLLDISCRLGRFDESENSIYLLDKYKTNKWTNSKNIYTLPLSESIHYRCLVEDNFEDYSIYIDVTKQSPFCGIDTANNFINYYSKKNLLEILEILKEYKVDIRNGVIHDGLHRLSTILFLTNLEYDLDESLIK